MFSSNIMKEHMKMFSVYTVTHQILLQYDIADLCPNLLEKVALLSAFLLVSNLQPKYLQLCSEKVEGKLIQLSILHGRFQSYSTIYCPFDPETQTLQKHHGNR